MRTIATILLVFCLTSTGCRGKAIQLSNNGNTTYKIVIADEPAIQVQAAADELAEFLQQVTGAVFPIVRASDVRGEHQILVGPSDALAKLKLRIDWPSLGPEGFVIRTVRQKLVIAGGPRRGTINAVYTFLEDVLGCRWYTPKFSVIPSKKVLSLKKMNIRTVPAFESRQIWRYLRTDRRDADAAWRSANVDWSARQRLNVLLHGRSWDQIISKYPQLAGCITYVISFGHTLGHGRLLAYAEFPKHPEYFALIDGKRNKQGVCLTNPDVIPVVAAAAKEWIRSDPKGQIIPISQVDGAFELAGCRCPDCKAAFEKYGMTGTVMRFVNQVAAEIEKDYPDILVDTFAYHWTRKPPKGVEMNKNVVVRYCMGGPICYYHPFDRCSFNTSEDPQAQSRGVDEAYKDLVRWTRISPRVWVWYYLHGGDRMHPVPHFGSLSRNFKRMRDAGVQGMLIQDNDSGKQINTGGLLDLQAYLLAKLMWDPDYDVQKGIEEFSRACYGAAAPYILSFVKMVNDADTYSGAPQWMKYHYRDLDMAKFPGFHCPGGAMSPIKQDKLADMDKLFENAERAAANDPGSLERVRLVRLAANYVIMLYADKDDPLRAKAIEGFFPLAKKLGISTLRLPVNRREVTVEAFRNAFLGLDNPPKLEGTTAIPFSQQWRFATDSADTGVSEKWYKTDFDDSKWVTVRSDTGQGWERVIGSYDGYGWYRGELPTLPEDTSGKHVYIYFGAIDEQAWVYLNGKLVAEQTVESTGGMSIHALWERPFIVDVTKLLRRDGPNTLAVRVHNSMGQGGIWRPVFLVVSDIEDIKPRYLNGSFGIGIWSVD